MDFLAKLKKEIAESKAAQAKPKQPLPEKTVFTETRKEIRLSQSGFARLLGVPVRTLQGWELGRPIPKSIMILAELLREVPVVRKRLLPTAFNRAQAIPEKDR